MFRVKDGRIVEHWDVLQDEVTATVNGNPMFTVPATARGRLTGTDAKVRPEPTATRTGAAARGR
jgi:hypothetical protein